MSAGQPGRARQRGFTIGYVLVLAAVAAVGAAAFQRAFLSWHPDVVRGPARARARALLEATWEEARARLIERQPLEALARQGPDERVVLRHTATPDDPAADQRLEIEVWVRSHGHWVGRRLRVDLARIVAGGRWPQVAVRQELGE